MFARSSASGAVVGVSWLREFSTVVARVPGQQAGYWGHLRAIDLSIPFNSSTNEGINVCKIPGTNTCPVTEAAMSDCLCNRISCPGYLDTVPTS